MKTMLLLLTVFYSSLLPANTSFIKDVFQDDTDDEFRLYLLQDSTLWDSYRSYPKYTVVQYEAESRKSNLEQFYSLDSLPEEIRVETLHSVKEYKAPISFPDLVFYYFKLCIADPNFQPEYFHVNEKTGRIRYSDYSDFTKTKRISYPPSTHLIQTTSGMQFIGPLSEKQNWSAGDSLIALEETLINLTSGRFIYTMCGPFARSETIASCTPKAISFVNENEIWNFFHPESHAPLSPGAKVYIATSSQKIKSEINISAVVPFLEESDITSYLDKTIHWCYLLPEEGDTYYILWRIEE